MGDLSEGLMVVVANECDVVVAENVGRENLQPCSEWGSVHTCEGASGSISVAVGMTTGYFPVWVGLSQELICWTCPAGEGILRLVASRHQ